MPSPARNPITARAAGLAGLLAVALWASPAHAGCGDHVVILSAKPSGGKAAEVPAPPPCRGPHCSLQQPLLPTPLPAAPVYLKWTAPDAVMPADPPHEQRPAGPRWTAPQPFPSAGHPADIFHPPRRG